MHEFKSAQIGAQQEGEADRNMTVRPNTRLESTERKNFTRVDKDLFEHAFSTLHKVGKVTLEM